MICFNYLPQSSSSSQSHSTVTHLPLLHVNSAPRLHVRLSATLIHLFIRDSQIVTQSKTAMLARSLRHWKAHLTSNGIKAYCRKALAKVDVMRKVGLDTI